MIHAHTFVIIVFAVDSISLDLKLQSLALSVEFSVDLLNALALYLKYLLTSLQSI